MIAQKTYNACIIFLKHNSIFALIFQLNTGQYNPLLVGDSCSRETNFSSDRFNFVYSYTTCIGASINGQGVFLQGLPELAIFEELVPLIFQTCQRGWEGSRRGVQMARVHHGDLLWWPSPGMSTSCLGTVDHRCLVRGPVCGASGTPASSTSPWRSMVCFGPPSSTTRRFVLRITHRCTLPLQRVYNVSLTHLLSL